MTGFPKISVIMPVYNAAEYIEDSVKSILMQSFSDIEIICVDDCSKDTSLQILRKIAQEDNRVRVLALGQNCGAGGARNAGIKIATGEYITFVDADDVIEGDLYARAAVYMQEQPDQIIWGLVEEHYNHKGAIAKKVVITPTETKAGGDSLVDTILQLEEKTLFGYQWNSLYRAEIIVKHNIKIEDALFYEDYFFNLAFARHMQSIVLMEYAGYHYGKRCNNSITHQFTKDYFALSYRRIESMYEFCKERGYDKPYLYNVLGNRLLRYTLSALCRNLDKQSGMDKEERKKWFTQSRELSLYKQLLPACKLRNPIYWMLKVAFEKCAPRLAYFMAWIIRLVR